MKAKLWTLFFGTTLVVALFHQSLKAEDTAPPAASNVFLDEGDADYEMPKTDAGVDTKATDTKTAAKKASHKVKDAQNTRVPAAAADDEDDDKSTAGTKGDTFDQMQNPEAAAPAAEKKSPSKAKKPEDLSKTTPESKALAAKFPVKNLKDIIQEAQKAASSLSAPKAAAPKAATVKEVVEKEEAPAAKAAPSRKTASVQFKSGFKSTKDGECVMYADADKTSTQVLVVKGSKKLWVEQNGDWYKAYHKKGSGFLPAECFE